MHKSGRNQKREAVNHASRDQSIRFVYYQMRGRGYDSIGVAMPSEGMGALPPDWNATICSQIFPAQSGKSNMTIITNTVIN